MTSVRRLMRSAMCARRVPCRVTSSLTSTSSSTSTSPSGSSTNCFVKSFSTNRLNCGYPLYHGRLFSSSCSDQRHRCVHTSAVLEDSFKIQDEEDFNARVLKSKKPVVVQFHATWCGPCKMLSPRMEKSVAALKDAVDLAQVDIDDNPEIAVSYSVGAVPAVMAVKDGKVVDKFVGLKDEDQIDTFVAKLAN